jgi:hypothetical protein
MGSRDFFSYFISFHPLYGIRDAQAKLLLLFCRQNFVFWKEIVRTNLTCRIPHKLHAKWYIYILFWQVYRTSFQRPSLEYVLKMTEAAFILLHFKSVLFHLSEMYIITRTRTRTRIIIIIIRNGAKTISLQMLFGRLNKGYFWHKKQMSPTTGQSHIFGGSKGVGVTIESYRKLEISYINVDNF